MAPPPGNSRHADSGGRQAHILAVANNGGRANEAVVNTSNVIIGRHATIPIRAGWNSITRVTQRRPP